MTTEREQIGMSFLDYLDRLNHIIEGAALAAEVGYAETCVCGGSIRIGRDVPRQERRQMWGRWHLRHLTCAPLAKGATADA